MKGKGDTESHRNITQLIFASPRLMFPDIDFVSQSIIADLRSAIALDANPISFKALIIHAWETKL